MDDDEITRLRNLEARIKELAIEAGRVLAETKDERVHPIVAASLADLRRAWELIEEQLQKKNPPSAD